MADDGYLIGYEDSNGNFVEVGRFNNKAENTSKPVQIKHANSGETIELDSSGLSTNSVSTDSLVIGGTIYEEDDNSPINVTNTTSTTYTLSNSSDGVVILPAENQDASFNELQVNGDTNGNYTFVDNGNTQTTGANQFTIPNVQRLEMLKLMSTRGNQILMSATPMGSLTSDVLQGENENINPPITQFTLKDDGGAKRDGKARVYRRDMNI